MAYAEAITRMVGVTLTLTMGEAETLRMLMTAIGGFGYNRDNCQDIGEALEAIGVANPDEEMCDAGDYDHYFEGTVIFNDVASF